MARPDFLTLLDQAREYAKTSAQVSIVDPDDRLSPRETLTLGLEETQKKVFFDAVATQKYTESLGYQLLTQALQNPPKKP